MSVSLPINDDAKALDFVKAISWSWRHGADVINCSWSCSERDVINLVLDSALIFGRGGKGCVIVTSAGNSGGSVTYPGNYSNKILAVSSISKNGSIRTDSSHGRNVHVAAPGSGILSTTLNNTVSYFSGTSAAAPHVAAVAALILERNPDLTNVQVRDIIAKTAKKYP